MSDAIVFNPVSIQAGRQLFHKCAKLFFRHGRIITFVGDFALQLLVSGFCCLLQPCLDVCRIAVHESVPSDSAGVKHGERCHSFDPLIALRSSQRIAAAPANTQRCNSVRIYIRKGCEKVYHATDVINSVGRIVTLPRFSAALALIRGVCCNRHIAHLCKLLGKQSCHLLLYAAVGMRHGYGRILLIAHGVKIRWGINIGSNTDAIQHIGNRMDIDLTRFIVCDSSHINQAELILAHFSVLHFRHLP